MNRSLLPLLPLATSVAMVFTAGTAAGQSLLQPPNLNLERPQVPAGANDGISTRSTVSGSITQSVTNSAPNTPSRQTIGVGNIVDLRESTGTVRAEGSLLGNLVQERNGSDRNGAQEIAIGQVAGLGRAQSIEANGVVEATITQRSNAGQSSNASGGLQRVEVGSLRDAEGGGSLRSSGLISGVGVVQTQADAVDQRVRVGSIESVNLQSGNSVGLVTGFVTQTAVGNLNDSAAQRLAVGTVSDTIGGVATADGTVSGTLAQSQNVAATQDVEVASIRDAIVFGRAQAVGRVSGEVLQSTNGPAAQRLDVGSISGQANEVQTNAVVTGNIGQLVFAGSGRASQSIAVGTASNTRGSVVTDAQVGASLAQSQQGGTGTRFQTLRIAGVADTTADQVIARAVVQGSVAQLLNNGSAGASQRIEIGSVVGAQGGTVRTDVVVDGRIQQTASGSGGGRGAQSILLGSVTAD